MCERGLSGSHEIQKHMDKTDFGQVLCKVIALTLLASLILLLLALVTGHHPSPVGDVRGFTDTEVVAHPDVPLDPNKNVIWCGTMALAWNETIAEFNGPLVFTPPIPIADALNRQEFTKSDIDPESYVAMSGFKLDHIDEKFRAELARKFGDAANPPRLDDVDSAATNEDVAIYAYLQKTLLFDTPFNQDEQLRFEGKKVASFGFGFETFASSEAPGQLTSEVRLLAYESDDDFIIELKTKSPGDQMVLAKVPSGKTLQETVDAVLPKIDPKVVWGIENGDKLAIPKVDFDLIKHFKEFEGKPVPGGRLNSVAENIVFRLNEKGAELKSFTTISETLAAVSEPTKQLNLIFNKPFLILLKRESSPRPYFAMWVGNPALLVSP
jgi:hypothetical protein